MIISNGFKDIVVQNSDGKIIVDLAALSSGLDIIINGISTVNSVRFTEPQSFDMKIHPPLMDSCLPIKTSNILGADIALPDGLERLSGWIVYDTRLDYQTGQMVPHVLEPVQSAPEKCVTWLEAKDHIISLREDGHSAAGFWNDADSQAMFCHIMAPVHEFNNVARLEKDPNTYGPYWGEESPRPGSDEVHAYDLGKSISTILSKKCGHIAHIRAVQPVPELAFSVPELTASV